MFRNSSTRSDGQRRSDKRRYAEGQVVGGRYVLGMAIGEGGMGPVYAARDRKDGSRVAVKVMNRNSLGDESAIRRFSREVLAMRAIRHPNVVRLLDAGIDRGGPFAVMELVCGPSLSTVLSRTGRLAPRTAFRIFLDAARGLAALHKIGIIHRDVKPSNILLHAPHGTFAAAKISDLGVARIMDDDMEPITGELHVLGTAAYMAPEQVVGDPVDVRTDVYGFGVALYCALTGRHPFEGDWQSVMAKQVLDERPWPSDIEHDLSPSMDRIVVSAMRRAIVNRYPSIAAMSADMERELGLRPGQVVGTRVRASEDSYEPASASGWELLGTLRKLATLPSDVRRRRCPRRFAQTPVTRDEIPARLRAQRV